MTNPPSDADIIENDIKITSHSEKDIVNGCITLMNDMYQYMLHYLNHMGIEFDDDEAPDPSYTYFEIVQTLFLEKTNHSGGTSTINKCKELGLTSYQRVHFKNESE